MSDSPILTALRLPPELDAQVRRIAARYGVSKTALIKIVLAGYLASADPSLLSSGQVEAVDRAVELARREKT